MASYVNRGTRKKPSWQYSVSRTVDGKYSPIRKGGFKTKAEAVAEALEVENDLKRGIVSHLTPINFAEYFQNYIDVYKSHVGKNTFARYQNSVDRVKEYFDTKAIQEITKEEYRIFINSYQKDGNKAKSTVRKLNTHIRGCVQEAVDEGIIRVDFTRKVVFPGVEAKRTEEKHLDYEESQLLQNYLLKKKEKSSEEYLILLALTSGMRFGELVGLTRKDFNFKNNTINIDKTWGYNNKMEKGFGETKNRQSVRRIKINKKIMEIFSNLFENTPENTLRLVFYSPTSKYHCVSNTSCANHLKKICSELGIQKISPHGLRHTKASIMLYRGVSIYYVSEFLGHKDIETTLKDYTHVVKELRVKDEMKMLEEII